MLRFESGEVDWSPGFSRSVRRDRLKPGLQTCLPTPLSPLGQQMASDTPSSKIRPLGDYR